MFDDTTFKLSYTISMADINETLKSTPEISAETKPVLPREIVDQKKEAPVPPELRSFLQRMEQPPAATPTFDPNGQPQLTPSVSTNPKIVLPITRTTFVSGFKKRIDDVGLWLSKFLFREIKLKEGNISFKPDDS